MCCKMYEKDKLEQYSETLCSKETGDIFIRTA